ncbi:acetone carboxylase [Nocardioides stalactiti]|uniref:acetone carboxylase n=1 Tax=Nocardioides stalactiti TaxID=2755356 RepID=UPI0016040D7F|nr:acetone carboxylase [Nocardioides stalactiti]
MTEASAASSEPDVCSAKGCRADATWQVLWNNPRIHTPDRRKVWLACDEHRESLEAFLGARGFLRDTVPHPAPGA